ncbi:hypothetical protein FB451DRAFT_1184948 [Mycena latifolia]|nr:hypothetical protein FB451DRAFT_1184948 [Mycena latifolia]
MGRAELFRNQAVQHQAVSPESASAKTIALKQVLDAELPERARVRDGRRAWLEQPGEQGSGGGAEVEGSVRAMSVTCEGGAELGARISARCRSPRSWFSERRGLRKSSLPLESTFTLTKISGNVFREAHALQVESVCWNARGSYKHSISLYKRARHLLDLYGMSGGDMDHNLIILQAEIHSSKSEYLEARKILSQIIHEVPVEKSPYVHAFALNIADLEMTIGGSKHGVQSL